jgi:LPXTG-motif cell wall-anchored protein
MDVEEANLIHIGHLFMTNPRASLRSDNCPISIGMSVRFELEQVSAFAGIRIMVPGQTYALANITSVRTTTVDPKIGGSVLTIVLGALVTLGALVGLLAGEGDRYTLQGQGLLQLGGLALISGGILVLVRKKRFYAVVLGTAGSEVQSWTSRDRDFISRVVAALNEAIVARG